MDLLDKKVFEKPTVAALLVMAFAVCMAPARSEELSPSSSESPSQADLVSEDLDECLAELSAEKVLYEYLGSVALEECQLDGAVKLSGVATMFGNVGITGEPTLLCGFAKQFASWVRDVGAPLTLAYTGQELAQIETGPGFACRTRYGKPGEKLSEHAKGNALDIASFVLADQTRILFNDEASDSARSRSLVRTLRTTACGYFTTILGPGSNSAHAEHLHVDLGLHGKTANYRICE